MIEISISHENGKDVYSFEANNTRYDVFKEDEKHYCVWSKRKGFSGFPVVKLMTLSDMQKRSKSLKNLATLISGQ